MVKFESWRDMHLFLKEYAYCSCLNCVGYTDKEYSGLFVCMKTLSPVQLGMLQVCAEWQGHNGELLKDYEDKSFYKFSDETAKKIDELGLATFDEIKELIEHEESKK